MKSQIRALCHIKRTCRQETIGACRIGTLDSPLSDGARSGSNLGPSRRASASPDARPVLSRMRRHNASVLCHRSDQSPIMALSVAAADSARREILTPHFDKAIPGISGGTLTMVIP